jgi:hypothetical protein
VVGNGHLTEAQLAELRARVAEQGRRRAAALAEADAALEAMRNDLVTALDAGVPLAELARLAAVGRPTLYRLRRVA